MTLDIIVTLQHNTTLLTSLSVLLVRKPHSESGLTSATIWLT